MKKIQIILLFLIINSFIFSQTDYETNFLQTYLNIENAFLQLGGDYGTTFFPFLMLDYGGRSRGLSGAFVAVADDISALEKNPAGTASFRYTEIYASHNKLMGDVNYNSLAFCMRFNDLGFGLGSKVLYMPFTHFDELGENVGSGVITYSVITFNLAYNFLRSYEFFGLSVGANIKLYVYGVPEQIAADQSSINAAFDIGILTRFNFLKAYKKAEKNFSIGLAVKNLGPFTEEEPPPTTLSIGIGYKPIEILLITLDFNYLINYSKETYKNWNVNIGVEWKFTKYTSLLAGFSLKSSPSFSLGLNLNFDDFTVTVVYNPDFLDVSKFSVSASLRLGDLGRAKKEFNTLKMYSDALKYMTDGNYREAKKLLKEIIKNDRAFTPAKKSLKQCEKLIETENELNIIIDNKRLQ